MTSCLDFADEQVTDVLAGSNADSVVEGPVVERRRQDVGEAEGEHERDPT